MHCPTQERFLAYLESRLDETELSSFQLHVDECDSCRSRVAVLRLGRFAPTESMDADRDTWVEPHLREPAPAFDGTARYALVRPLGAGGMGIVYEVHDRQLDARVALKTLRHIEPRMLLRLKSEFRALADLHHPNLVQLHELKHEDGHWFFTMELLGGESFLHWVRPDDRCDLARLRDALAQLAAGLEALHRAGKVHCDLKPSNVLVEPDGRLVILDFGLVSETTSAARHGHYPLGGTPEYMAPEQASAAAVDAAADWYAVGTMLFEALTGRRPFVGERHQVARKKQHEDAPAPATLAADLPPDLEALCRALLRREASARPDGATLRAQLGRVAPRAPTLDDAGAPFVGRAAEREPLEAALAASRTHAVALLVEGESGVGKSALVRRFADGVAEAGGLVLRGRCYERESVPYKALDGIVDALAHRLEPLGAAQRAALLPADMALVAQAFPVLGGLQVPAPGTSEAPPLDPVEQRHRMFVALRALLVRVAEAQAAPLVLVVDDLQWSDADSLALLGELLRAPALLLLATLRPGSGIALEGDVRTLPLLPLGETDAQALAGLLLGDRAADAALVAREAGGHPLFIAELARRTHASERAAPTLDQALGQRIAELDAAPAALLELLALAAAPLPSDLLARAADAPIEAYTRHVAGLRAAYLVRATGAALETYHDRIRAAALGRLDEPRRRAGHRRLALALEASGRAEAETLLVHFAGAGEAVRAAAYAVTAADHAATALAFTRAAELYRQALALDPARADAADLEERLGDALGNAGRQGEAADAYLAAARRRDGDAALDLKRRAAEQLLGGGRTEEGLVVLDEVLRAIGLRRPGGRLRALAVTLALRARLQLRGLGFVTRDEATLPAAALRRVDICRSATNGLLACNPWGGFEFHSRTLLYALAAGEPVRLGQVLASEISFAALAGPLGRRRARTLLPIAEALAARVDRPIVHAQLGLAKGLTAFYDGRWGDSERELGRAETVLREQCQGVTGDLNLLAIFRLSTLFVRGDIVGMRPLLARVLRDAVERGERFGGFLFRTAVSAVVRLADDDAAEGWRQTRIAAEWDARSPQAMHYAPKLLGEVFLDLYGDDGGAAWRRLHGGWRGLDETHALRPQWFRAQFWHLRGAAALAAAAVSAPAERRGLVAEARRAARRLGREPDGWVTPLALLLRAGIARLEGDATAAVARLAEAEAGFDRAEMTLHAAVARHHRGALVGGDAGRALTARAAEWFRAQQIRVPARFCRLILPLD